jgi:DNA-directed RNA polymerase subunit beta'
MRSVIVNFPVPKSKLGDLILATYRTVGPERTIVVLDDLKELGFKMATKAGISIGIDDMIIPETKPKIVLSHARKRIDEVDNQYRMGVITSW